MKKMKKLSALLMTIAMLLSLLVAANAETRVTVQGPLAEHLVTQYATVSPDKTVYTYENIDFTNKNGTAYSPVAFNYLGVGTGHPANATDFVFKNCTFAAGVALYAGDDLRGINFTIENCTFEGTTNSYYCMTIIKAGDVVLRDNTVVSTVRGFNLDSCKSAWIEDNTFSNSSAATSDNMAIQFAGTWGKDSITVINNTFDNAYAAFRIHSSFQVGANVNTALGETPFANLFNTIGDSVTIKAVNAQGIVYHASLPAAVKSYIEDKIPSVDPNPIPVDTILLDKDVLNMKVGGKVTLRCTVTPAETTFPLVWTSSKETVARVVNGEVTAMGLGEAVITAECGGKTASCTVNVIQSPNGITLDKPAMLLNKGDSANLIATRDPASDTTPITWESSDTSVAIVVNGTVVAIGEGNTTITATCGLYSASCEVTVKVGLLTGFFEQIRQAFIDFFTMLLNFFQNYF